MDVREEEVEIESKEIDHFNFEVFDPRNVFTDDTFTYSANQKPWITLRYEKTYDELKAEEEDMGYINLDKVKKLMPPAETDTSLESVNKNVGQEKFDTPISKNFDTYERHGLFWSIIKERDDDGYPFKGRDRHRRRASPQEEHRTR